MYLLDDVSYGRSFVMEAKGANIEEMELSAFDGAREFFGPEPKLIMYPGYQARKHPGYQDDPGYYYAEIMIIEVLDDGPS